MDKIIEKKKGIARAFTLKALPYWLGSAVAVLLIVLLARSSNGAMRIDPDTLTIATVIEGEFNDYIRLNGQVKPMTTIQLSPLEGGVVQEIINMQMIRRRKDNLTIKAVCYRRLWGANY